MIRFNIEKFPIGFVAKSLCQSGGSYIYSLTCDEEVPNGVFLGRGDFVELDHYKAAAAGTATGFIRGKAANGNYYVEIDTCDEDTLFIANVPLIEYEWSKEFLKEENFFNGIGSELRAYQLRHGDVIELNKAALGLDGEPTKDQEVTLAAYGDSEIAKVFR